MNPLALTVLMSLAQSFPAQKHQLVELPSGTTHVQESGAGPTVVLVHGVGRHDIGHISQDAALVIERFADEIGDDNKWTGHVGTSRKVIEKRFFGNLT